MIQLRNYQQDLSDRIDAAWAQGARNVMGTLATGGGKTVIFSNTLRREPSESVAIAHRQELIGQTSIALARNEVPHRVLAPKNVIGWIVTNHVKETGRSWYNGNAKCTVAGVDTLLARAETMGQWGARQRLWIIDEGHHILRDNKWGKVLSLFHNARGLAVTATPGRADGKGLGRHADGVIDVLIQGAGMRELIAAEHLCPYRIYAPPSDMDLSGVKISAATGDYVPEQLRLASRKSHIIGDVVTHYLRLAPGKLGVTFATDVETAKDLTDQFRTAGVPAELITAKTPGQVRVELLRKFRRREILQIVNVDLFGEGFDLPSLEVVSMARPTMSFGLYCQQFGRVVRTLSGKAYGLVLDHVGNVAKHGLPDQPRQWSLDRRESRRGGDSPAIPVKTCPNCMGVYSRLTSACPYCGHKAEPLQRSAPEFVDGDLAELDLDALRGIEAAVDKVDMPWKTATEWMRGKLPDGAFVLAGNRHRGRQEAQAQLRDQIARWAGFMAHYQRPESESYKRFYFKFGVDVLSAQALDKAAAEELAAKVGEEVKRLEWGGEI